MFNRDKNAKKLKKIEAEDKKPILWGSVDANKLTGGNEPLVPV